jgi:hypothetical protein
MAAYEAVEVNFDDPEIYSAENYSNAHPGTGAVACQLTSVPNTENPTRIYPPLPRQE